MKQLSVAFAGIVALKSVFAQQSTFPATPLASKHFSYPTGVPYKVDTDTNLVRGPQTGYNICNSTTENQDSLCQTSFVNSVDDFCLWAPIHPNSSVGSVEGEMVAWCTKPGRGTRLIPRNALQGVQFMKTTDYVQVVGFIDQKKINIDPQDFGGEMDPHGADLRGNPLGGILFSNAWSGNNNSYTQAIEWHNFMGSNQFCIKACDPSKPNARRYCEHVFDRIGCAYNAPNNAKNGTFETCLGENQDFPGVYQPAPGVTVTYQQPPEAAGPIVNMPYTARVPESSSCTQYTSSVLYTALASVVAPGDADPTSTGAASGTRPASPTNTGNSGASNGVAPAVETVLVATLSSFAGVLVSVCLFA